VKSPPVTALARWGDRPHFSQLSSTKLSVTRMTTKPPPSDARATLGTLCECGVGRVHRGGCLVQIQVPGVSASGARLFFVYFVSATAAGAGVMFQVSIRNFQAYFHSILLKITIHATCSEDLDTYCLKLRMCCRKYIDACPCLRCRTITTRCFTLL